MKQKLEKVKYDKLVTAKEVIGDMLINLEHLTKDDPEYKEIGPKLLMCTSIVLSYLVEIVNKFEPAIEEVKLTIVPK